MPWFKVDDGFYDHPKVVDLPPEAAGLWVLAGSYCARHLTDGGVPRSRVARLGATESVAAELVAAGLWDETPEGYQFHDWSEYQPLRASIVEERRRAQERMRAVRAKSKDVRPNEERTAAERSTERSENFERSSATPTRPIPSRPDQTPEGVVGAARADVDRLCALLVELMRSNGDRVPTVTQAWKTEARLLLDRDGRDLEAAEGLMRWALADTFWKGNVRSLPKFRSRYDQLRHAADVDRAPARTKTNAQNNLDVVRRFAQLEGDQDSLEAS